MITSATLAHALLSVWLSGFFYMIWSAAICGRRRTFGHDVVLVILAAVWPVTAPLVASGILRGD